MTIGHPQGPSSPREDNKGAIDSPVFFVGTKGANSSPIQKLIAQMQRGIHISHTLCPLIWRYTDSPLEADASPPFLLYAASKGRKVFSVNWHTVTPSFALILLPREWPRQKP